VRKTQYAKPSQGSGWASVFSPNKKGCHRWPGFGSGGVSQGAGRAVGPGSTRGERWEGQVVEHPFLDVDRVAGLYAVVHDPTGRRYIGHSQDLRSRLSVHRGSLRSGRSQHRELQRLWSETHEREWCFVVLAYGEPDLWAAEQAAIRLAGADAINAPSPKILNYRRGWLLQHSTCTFRSRGGTRTSADPRLAWLDRRLRAGVPVFAVALHADLPIEVVQQFEAGARWPAAWQWSRIEQALDEARESWLGW
jgi:hypothetical protein